jgi:hypothetical protein
MRLRNPHTNRVDSRGVCRGGSGGNLGIGFGVLDRIWNSFVLLDWDTYMDHRSSFSVLVAVVWVLWNWLVVGLVVGIGNVGWHCRN